MLLPTHTNLRKVINSSFGETHIRFSEEGSIIITQSSLVGDTYWEFPCLFYRWRSKRVTLSPPGDTELSLGVQPAACVFALSPAIREVGRGESLMNIQWWDDFIIVPYSYLTDFAIIAQGISWKILGVVPLGRKSIQNKSTVCHCGPMLSQLPSFLLF